MISHSITVVTISLLSLVMIAGCEKKSPQLPTQVAARVNANEITVHQVNNVLAQSKNINPEVGAQVKRAVLERLINQELARQKAVEAHLDQSPNVVQAIEAAKTEVLARAYLDGIARTLSKPTSFEINAYYSKHSELFQQRRVYSLEQITFAANADLAARLRKQLSNFDSFREVTDWLKTQGVKFIASREVRAAEQIPLEILPRVAAIKKGEIELFEPVQGHYQLIRLLNFMAAPMDQATATPYIERFLFNQALGDAIAKEMSELRKQAKIEYSGEFAHGAPASGAAVDPNIEADRPPGAATTRVEGQGK